MISIIDNDLNGKSVTGCRYGIGLPGWIGSLIRSGSFSGPPTLWKKILVCRGGLHPPEEQADAGLFRIRMGIFIIAEII